jgi:hypothetical protein
VPKSLTKSHARNAHPGNRRDPQITVQTRDPVGRTPFWRVAKPRGGGAAENDRQFLPMFTIFRWVVLAPPKWSTFRGRPATDVGSAPTTDQRFAGGQCPPRAVSALWASSARDSTRSMTQNDATIPALRNTIWLKDVVRRPVTNRVVEVIAPFFPNEANPRSPGTRNRRRPMRGCQDDHSPLTTHRSPLTSPSVIRLETDHRGRIE